jgi:hypothetical protein
MMNCPMMAGQTQQGGMGPMMHGSIRECGFVWLISPMSVCGSGETENQIEQILYPVANFRNTMNLLFEHWDFGFQRCSGPKQVNESTRRSA